LQHKENEIQLERQAAMRRREAVIEVRSSEMKRLQHDVDSVLESECMRRAEVDGEKRLKAAKRNESPETEGLAVASRGVRTTDRVEGPDFDTGVNEDVAMAEALFRAKRFSRNSDPK
jgi:hypothetical protein